MGQSKCSLDLEPLYSFPGSALNRRITAQLSVSETLFTDHVDKCDTDRDSFVKIRSSVCVCFYQGITVRILKYLFASCDLSTQYCIEIFHIIRLCTDLTVR